MRLAFRRLGLHLFKTSNGTTFLTSVLPNPIDPTRTIPAVRDLLEYLTAHPGCQRESLLKELSAKAGAAETDPKALAQQLLWLIDRGHVIEFSDGRLAVPKTTVDRIQIARKIEHRERPHRSPRKRTEGPALPPSAEKN